MAPFPSATSVWRTNTYPTLSPERPELSAKGKTVLITGGGTGIGAATASAFAAAGAARIALVGRREQPLHDTKTSIKQQFSNVDVFTASTDITKQDQVDRAFEDFLGDSELNVLISNAAVIGPMGAIANLDADQYVDSIHLNLKGATYVSQAFLRHAAKDAVVVEVNSSAAHVNFAPGFASYTVAKMAVYRHWDSVAFENPGLSVYHIQPGVIDTDMNRQAGGIAALGFEDNAALPGTFNVWLASPEARFLKSKYLWVNWDVDELKKRAKEIEGSMEYTIGLVGWPFGETKWTSGWKN